MAASRSQPKQWRLAVAAALVLFSAIFTAVTLLMTGIGLLGTTLSLQLTRSQVPVQNTGLIMAAYFMGVAFGGLFCHRLMERVGHIRAFVAFAAVATAIVMVHGLFFYPPAWAVLRFLTGICTVGLLTVIESWLNAGTEGNKRGSVLSAYMLLTYLGMAVGQQLLNLGSALDFNLYFIIGIFLSLCMVPLAVTHAVHPAAYRPERFNILALIRRSPIGMLGCFISGLLTSAFHAIGPVFADTIGLSVSELSGFMTAAIIGGLVLQWPIGKLSDRHDRIQVLSALGGGIALLSLVMLIVAKYSFVVLCAAVGIYGGLIFTVYPVSVARAHDLFEPKDIVAVSSALLIAYGIGAGIGPIASAGLMALTKTPMAFFAYSLLISGMFAAVAFVLRKKEKLEIVPVEEQVDFIPMRRTSAMALQIDPRAKE
jgi:MFS family permease